MGLGVLVGGGGAREGGGGGGEVKKKQRGHGNIEHGFGSHVSKSK